MSSSSDQDPTPLAAYCTQLARIEAKLDEVLGLLRTKAEPAIIPPKPEEWPIMPDNWPKAEWWLRHREPALKPLRGADGTGIHGGDTPDNWPKAEAVWSSLARPSFSSLVLENAARGNEIKTLRADLKRLTQVIEDLRSPKPPWDGCENKCPQCEERTPFVAGKSLSSALDYLGGINAGLDRLDPERAPGDPELVPVPPPRGEP